MIIFNQHPVSSQGYWASGGHGVCIHEIRERNHWNFYITITNWKTELTRYTTVIANLWLQQENVRCSLPVNHWQLEIYTTGWPKKTGPAFNIQYCKSSPTCTQVGRGVFKIFAMKHTGPVFLGHPVYVNRISAKLAYIHITQSPDDTCPSVP